MPILYPLRGGLHPETAAYAALLQQAGIVQPKTGAPLSEALVLGIGGGLGIGYILWEFKAHARRPHPLRVLVMGMRNRWQYADSLYTKLQERLGVRFAVAETGGARSAQAALDAALALGRPAMLWVDREHLPYAGLPADLSGCMGHTLVACGVEDGRVLIDDRALQPFRLAPEVLAAARGRIPSYKNRLLTVDAAGPIDLASAVRAGLADCAAHLAGTSDSFALPVLRKWARLMTDISNAKGWPRVFADRQGLFTTLVSVFEAVSDYGPAGGSLRGLYAAFLRESAALLDNPALLEVAERYEWLGKRWGILGEVALPTEVAPLARAKELIAQRAALLSALGGAATDALPALPALDVEMAAVREACDADFPLDEADLRHLFAEMQAEIVAIHEEEVRANAGLHAALR